MLDTKWTAVALKIEDFIRKSNFRKSFSAVTASSYHMTIYPIYQCGNQLIPPVQRWANATGQIISNQHFLPAGALIDEDEKAFCLLKTYLNEPLSIKYATLKIGTYMMSVQLEFEEQSLQRIRYVRNELAKVYGRTDFSIVNERPHILLAYANGKMKQLDPEEWNKLNRLVAPLNGAKLMLPNKYLFYSINEYHPYDANIDCRAVSFRAY